MIIKITKVINMQIQSFLLKFRGWVIFILLALISTVTCGTIYASVQQVYRNGANDPQIEAVETLEKVLEQGVPPDLITSQSDQIDMANSLSLFIMIFDKDGKSLASSGKLGESSPTPPNGIFDNLKKKGFEKFTWQPQKDVRVAAVGKKLNDDKGFVIVGRSLKEVENRVNLLTAIVAIGWLVLMALSAMLAYVISKLHQTAVIQETEIIAVTPSEETNTII